MRISVIIKHDINLQNKSKKNKKGEENKGMKMDWLKICTDYLIGLYVVGEKKYPLTKTKIGKLLSIAQIKQVYLYQTKKSNKEYLFEDTISKYNNCGTKIEKLNSYTDIYTSYVGFCKEEEKIISDIKRKNIEDYTKEYIEKVLIDPEKKDDLLFNLKIIKDVYINFGAYPADKLGSMLTELLNDKGFDVNEKVKIDCISNIVSTTNSTLSKYIKNTDNLD